MHERKPLVRSIKEKCRVCYTCVRECPAKAIRIAQGQAEVIVERCIGCGNCVRVCTQNAKEVTSSIDRIHSILTGPRDAALIVAPSFPVQFDEYDYRTFVGMLKTIGFTSVHEVAFGADLVAQEYRTLLAANPGRRYIATTCPGLVSYVEFYLPDLVPYLAPIVSPMVAAARALRSMHGNDLAVVFAGPCIAKKAEAEASDPRGRIDAVCTFVELEEILRTSAVDPHKVQPADFDPPAAGNGRLFALSRGLLQAAEITEDLITGDIVCADGRENFVEAVREFQRGTMEARLLEVLCCQGCIMGAGINKGYTLFQRRSRVGAYVRQRYANSAPGASRDDWSGLDLSRRFTTDDHRMPVPSHEDIAAILARMGKSAPGDELNCGACGYETCKSHAIAISNGLAESEMCLPYTIDQLRRAVKELAQSNAELASTQDALMQSEKMASMGQLAAGIAHEVNNPLGVVLMYSHLLLEQCAQGPMRDDVTMIVEQADRCRKIVSGLLNFARQNRIVRQAIDLRVLVADGLRMVSVPSNVAVVTDHRLENPVAELDRDQILQVLVNLLTNAIAAMPHGGTLTVETAETPSRVEFRVADSGIGIPKENLPRIFDPFFTTKPIGKGTGLGLAVAYGIVKMHSGEIGVESNSDPAHGPTGTRVAVRLPRADTQNQPALEEKAA